MFMIIVMIMIITIALFASEAIKLAYSSIFIEMIF